MNCKTRHRITATRSLSIVTCSNYRSFLYLLKQLIHLLLLLLLLVLTRSLLFGQKAEVAKPVLVALLVFST